MADLLSIGASGVRTYQTALTTTSENIANAGNASYVRRTPSIREISGGTGYNTSSPNGMGASAFNILRSGNAYADQSLRTASSDLSRTEAGSVWLERVETALASGGLSSRMTAFFAAGTALQADPTSTALRAGMLSAGTSVADAFGVTARALDDAAAELDGQAGQAAAELTRLNQAVLKVNQGLVRTAPGTSAMAGLLDQRDDLLQQMSALTDIDVKIDDVGRATVRATGPNGPVLVDPRDASEVAYGRTGNNVALAVRPPTGAPTLFDPDGGTLAGMVEGAQRIASNRDALGRIATDLVETVNAQQAAGDDLKGDDGKDFFTASATDPTVFTVALASGDGIAAAGRDKGTRDASNLAALGAKRSSVGFEGRVQSLVTDNAATLKQRRLVADAQTTIRDGAITTRSELTGVNLDNEAVDLLKFQQAYQASSRVIQVAKETFQSILEIR
ncbi:flagellar hook-associated protein 1 FlgK [Sphingomonas sp. BE138]|uniref:flagellar hook-associated protein FlgK n=1 Tax=Sphingomonas sp. BE138 TaxID=2817845 RepID=UPI00286075BB|nr:flagellar hook-associated protein FlgK [Sphingomonas sp. BE138]MDR6788952.1 flagellar hook-associated protein 1 FlgK [Sphingomonas sp. BE138]